MTEHLHHEEHYKCGDKISHECQEKDCGCAERFLNVADEAYLELLKEKIKVKIEKEKGDELEKLAEIVAKANNEKWKYKLAIKVKCEEYKNNLKEYFSSKC